MARSFTPMLYLGHSCRGASTATKPSNQPSGRFLNADSLIGLTLDNKTDDMTSHGARICKIYLTFMKYIA